MRESVFIYHWDCIAGRLAKSLCSENWKLWYEPKSLGLWVSSTAHCVHWLFFCLSVCPPLSLCHSVSVSHTELCICSVCCAVGVLPLNWGLALQCFGFTVKSHSEGPNPAITFHPRTLWPWTTVLHPSISSRLSRVLQMFFSLAPMVHWAHQHLIFKEQLNTKSSEWASVTQCNSLRQWIGSLWVTLIITYLWSYICLPM